MKISIFLKHTHSEVIRGLLARLLPLTGPK